MARLYQQPLCVFTALAVPWLTLAAPGWLSLKGIAPAWAVLWLLPWALVDGPFSGLIAGLSLGLILDGLSLGGASQIPVLVGLGWWWGRLGRRVGLIERSFNLGLLAWIGTSLLGLSLWLQIFWVQTFWLQKTVTGAWLEHWGWRSFLTQALVTGLVAPMLSSWLLLFWRRRSPN